MPVPIDHALGHAGRAAGEQDRGDVVGLACRRVARRHSRRRVRPAPASRRRATHAAPVVMRTRADFAQPSTTARECASGMPMKASGCASSRHCFSARRSMPGSTSTGTAPALNSANISRKNSGVGRTITTVRVPRDDAARREARGDRIAARIELRIGERIVVAAVAAGAAHRDLVAAFARQPRQRRGDVAGFGHGAIVGAAAASSVVSRDHR